MKICGYCNNEYDEKEVKCPVCRSKLVKHTQGEKSAAEQYTSIAEEIKNKRKSRSMILCIGAGGIVFIIFVIIFSLASYCNSPQREIDKEAKQIYEVAVQQIKEGDYESAIETLDDINVSWSDYSKVEGKKIEAVKGQLTDKVAKFEAEGDYESIITYINENVKDVSSDLDIKEIYDRSVEKYKEYTIIKSNECVDTGKYNEAINVLTIAIKIIGEDSEIKEKYLEVEKILILEKVKEYKNNNEYEAAIKYINDNVDIVGNDSNILSELNSCEDAYRNQIVEEAKKSYANNGYEEALDIINIGLSVLPKDEILEKEKNEYLLCVPIDLSTLEPYYESGALSWESNIEDTLGNVYLSAIRGWTDKDAYLDENYYLYDIAGNYNQLTATGIVRSEDKGDTGTALIYIYGDGRLLFSKQVTSKLKPYEIVVDVTGVEELKIEMYGDGDGGTRINAVMCNVMLQKVR